MILETMRFPTCWSQSRSRRSRSGRRGINRRGRLSMSGRDHSRRCSRRRCKGRRGHRSYVFKRKRGGWRGAGGAGSVMMRTYYIARCTLGPPPRNLDSRSLSRDRRQLPSPEGRVPSCEQRQAPKVSQTPSPYYSINYLEIAGAAAAADSQALLLCTLL
jgi:hypothetical protein